MDVKLPQAGRRRADSGVVVGIFVKEGDTVAKDQPILELENEKAVASIPSPAAGVVEKVYVKSGDRVGVGQRLLISVGGGGGAAALRRRLNPRPNQPKRRRPNLRHLRRSRRKTRTR